MSLRTIVTQGDPVLAKTCRPVEKFDQKLHELLDDMKETLVQANGVGLAAPQIGILRRVVIVMDAEENMVELVNPQIIASDGEQTGLEGCLSVPGKYGVVTRPATATVRAQDRNGNFFEMSGEGIVARCFCHELEHLDGHLFVEHTDRLYTVEELESMEDENA
ncbi:peptide deformylase [Pseudoflavonifractor capillosus]|uniref:peptide deformylase n=1 Tax=Pseudoflavonifractor capillosus TaxID=106588 RepID=UPI00195E39E6|nr:peptide deformylase [Pseudoflavonifractor capillosus]MBM6896421.1 peptide deformylase [Pseudoflavonifractor capillosus]